MVSIDILAYGGLIEIADISKTTFQNALLIDKYSILIRIVLRLAIVGPIDKK